MSWRTSGDHPNYNNVENGQKRTIKGTGVLVSWRTSGDHPNYSNVRTARKGLLKDWSTCELEDEWRPSKLQ